MPPPEYRVRPATEDDAPGAFACFPYDRALIERFRAAFPRARWRGEAGCWLVPGTRASRRLDRWMARELDGLDRHADAKGRDAFAFAPLPSRFLDASGDELVVRTPYSRTVVAAMRVIPWARWNPAERAWRVPFRSFEALRARWPEIEAAARRNEPDERRRRAAALRADPAALARVRERAREGRRRRFPVLLAEPPPLGVPVVAPPFGVVVFDEPGDEPADPAAVPDLYAHARPGAGPLAWARWRRPGWRELAAAKPAADAPAAAPARGWWMPTAVELEERRRVLRRSRRADAPRQGEGTGDAGAAARNAPPG